MYLELFFITLSYGILLHSIHIYLQYSFSKDLYHFYLLYFVNTIFLILYVCLFFQFSCSVVSNCLQPHGLRHVRLTCPLPTPGDCTNSCPLSWWCHSTIWSSIVPFSSCLLSFPASESFPMSRFFSSGGQSTGALASATVLPMNIQDWFLLGLTGLGPCCLRDSQVSYNTTVQKHQLFGAKRSLWSTLTFLHDTEKTRALTRWIFVSKVMSLRFNMLSRLVLTFRPRSKRPLISWLQPPSAVILETL